MLKGHAWQGYNHGSYIMVFYRGLAFDPTYVDGFVERVAGRVTPMLKNHERIVELNRSEHGPEWNITDREAGTNQRAAG